MVLDKTCAILKITFVKMPHAIGPHTGSDILHDWVGSHRHRLLEFGRTVLRHANCHSSDSDRKELCICKVTE